MAALPTDTPINPQRALFNPVNNWAIRQQSTNIIYSKKTIIQIQRVDMYTHILHKLTEAEKQDHE